LLSRLMNPNPLITPEQTTAGQYYYGVSIEDPYARITPTIDGLAQKGEWENDSYTGKMTLLSRTSGSGPTDSFLSLKHDDNNFYILADFTSSKTLTAPTSGNAGDDFQVLIDTADDNSAPPSPNLISISGAVEEPTSPNLEIYGIFGTIPYKDEIVAKVGLGPSFNSSEPHVQYEVSLPMKIFTEKTKVVSPNGPVVGFGMILRSADPQNYYTTMFYSQKTNGGGHFCDLILSSQTVEVDEFSSVFSSLATAIGMGSLGLYLANNSRKTD